MRDSGLEVAVRDAEPTLPAVEPFEGGWVDDYLLAGNEDEECLWIGEPVSRGSLAARVAARADEFAGAGLRAGGTVALRLPPSLGYVESLLAAWRAGAQVSLLDHRLTEHEVTQVLARLKPQLVVSAGEPVGPTGPTPVVATYPEGEPAATPHALLQLSSGSTGPSKVIGRTADNLLAELVRYRQIDGTPQPGERVVLLASMVHVLGLVGGLLYGLYTGVRQVLPRSIATEAVLAAVAADTTPTTVIGVPFHIEFLTVAGQRRQLPQLKRMTVGGELVRPAVRRAFLDRYEVPLGVMYGMTEVGVIATDLSGEHWPALQPAPGMTVQEEAGQLRLGASANPYVGATDPGRWVDGWLYTRDAGTVDPATGLVTVLGRLDSQVSVGGLKVDLTEVEQVLAELPGVAEVVVGYDRAIEAFVVLGDQASEPHLKEQIATRLASYKRPRRITLVDKLPRTATGKLVRDMSELRRAAARANHVKERSGTDV